MLPSSCILDGPLSPDTGRSVEVHEESPPCPRRLFHPEMAVDAHRLKACEQRVVMVDMAPSRLDHTDPRIHKIGEGLL